VPGSVPEGATDRQTVTVQRTVAERLALQRRLTRNARARG
jgi:hypothetical protein